MTEVDRRVVRKAARRLLPLLVLLAAGLVALRSRTARP